MENGTVVRLRAQYNWRKNVQVTTGHEYVFWCGVTHKWGLNFLGHVPKKLVKIVLSTEGIRSDGSIWADKQMILNVPWQEISEVTSVLSATAVHEGI